MSFVSTKLLYDLITIFHFSCYNLHAGCNFYQTPPPHPKTDGFVVKMVHCHVTGASRGDEPGFICHGASATTLKATTKYSKVHKKLITIDSN